MNEYPEELRNPVVPVVALVGQAAIHPIIEKNILTKMLYPIEGNVEERGGERRERGLIVSHEIKHYKENHYKGSESVRKIR